MERSCVSDAAARNAVNRALDATRAEIAEGADRLCAMEAERLNRGRCPPCGAAASVSLSVGIGAAVASGPELRVLAESPVGGVERLALLRLRALAVRRLPTA